MTYILPVLYVIVSYTFFLLAVHFGNGGCDGYRDRGWGIAWPVGNHGGRLTYSIYVWHAPSNCPARNGWDV